jgi:transcriptional regulator with XRE-family HTH domain
MTTGRLMIAARERLGLTQKQLAEAVGLSAQYINDLEHDRRALRVAAPMYRIAAALDIPPDLLCYGAGQLPEDVRGAESPKAVLRAFRAFRREIEKDGAR